MEGCVEPQHSRLLLPGLIDLVEHTAVVEVFGLSFLPAAESLVDRQQPQVGKCFEVLGIDPFNLDRPKEMFRGEIASRWRVQELDRKSVV